MFRVCAPFPLSLTHSPNHPISQSVTHTCMYAYCRASAAHPRRWLQQATAQRQRGGKDLCGSSSWYAEFFFIAVLYYFCFPPFPPLWPLSLFTFFFFLSLSLYSLFLCLVSSFFLRTTHAQHTHNTCTHTHTHTHSHPFSFSFSLLSTVFLPYQAILCSQCWKSSWPCTLIFLQT